MLDQNQSNVHPQICSSMDCAEAGTSVLDGGVDAQFHQHEVISKNKHQELLTLNMANKHVLELFTGNDKNINIADVMDTRLLLEPVIVQNAAFNRNDEDIKKLGECLLALQNENNPQKLTELLNEFHSLLAAATQNDILFSIIEHLNFYSTPFEIHILSQKNHTKSLIIEGYTKVFEAVIKRSGVTASKIMHEYLLQMQSILNEMMIMELSGFTKMPR